MIENNNLIIPENIDLRKPCGYLEFVNLQMCAEKIITDSGGIQKEAYLLKKGCITLRSETEWVETVESGWNLLLDINKNVNIMKEIEEFTVPSYQPEIFGSNVAKKMTIILNKLL